MVVLSSEASRPLEEPTMMQFLILSLATFRLTRLMVYDKITAFFREQFWDVVEVRGKRVLEKPQRGPRRTIADLLSCPWCIGMWMGATVVFFYHLTLFAWFPIMFLAVAGLGSLLQIATNLLGWRAEQARLDTEG